MARNTQPILKRCRTLGLEPTVLGIDKKSNKNPKKGRRKQQARDKEKIRNQSGGKTI